MCAAVPVEVFTGQDFYVPGFSVFIEGKEPLKAMNDVISLSYSDSLTSIDSFELTINNWDAETRQFKYSDSDLFNPWKDVQVFMGYYRNGTDERRRMLNGEITTLSPNFPASGAPTLTVRGLNVLHKFRLKKESPPFRGLKDTEIAQKLVTAIAEQIKKQTSGLLLQLDPKDVETNLKKEQPVEYLVMNNEYPILFLMERARRIGYELTVEEKPTGTPRVTTFHYRPTSDIDRKTYVLEWGKTLISFQPTLQTANQVAEVTVRGWDPRGKVKIEGKATRASMLKHKVIDPSSDLFVTEPALTARIEIIADKPIQDKTEANDLAEKTLRQIAQDIVVAKGKTIGLPDLRAGVKVQIKGLGKRFSGNENKQDEQKKQENEGKPFVYLITETTHTIGDGGYTTDFTARMEKA